MYALFFALWFSSVVLTIAFLSGATSLECYRETTALYGRIRYYREARALLSVVGGLLKEKAVHVGETFTLKEKGESWSVTLHDAGSGVNPNSLKEEQLRRLLRLCRVETGAEMDALVDAFMDWRDPDSRRRLNGAEADYYQSLPVPYKPRNGPILDVREIALIKGFKGVYPCISRLMSTYGRGKIDVNDADKKTLEALGFTEEEAERVLERRREGPIESWDQLREVVPEVDRMDARDLIGLEPSGVYEVTMKRDGRTVAVFVWDSRKDRVLEYR